MSAKRPSSKRPSEGQDESVKVGISKKRPAEGEAGDEGGDTSEGGDTTAPSSTSSSSSSSAGKATKKVPKRATKKAKADTTEATVKPPPNVPYHGQFAVELRRTDPLGKTKFAKIHWDEGSTFFTVFGPVHIKHKPTNGPTITTFKTAEKVTLQY